MIRVPHPRACFVFSAVRNVGTICYLPAIQRGSVAEQYGDRWSNGSGMNEELQKQYLFTDSTSQSNPNRWSVYFLHARIHLQGERFGVGLEAFPPGPPRVAVCFFGLARSLKWTLPSVQKRLLDVLEEGGMKVDMFAHTYDVLEVRAAVTGAAWFRMFRCLQRVLRRASSRG